jgi:hypothetical protein
MSTIITAGNATNGLTFSPDNTGQLSFRTGTGAGTAALVLDPSQNAVFAGTVTSSTGALYPLVSGTAVASTSGTSITFTGIPSTAKRITVMFSGVSTSGTSNYLVQIGSGSVTTTGYTSTVQQGATSASSTIGFIASQSIAAARFVYGDVRISTLGSFVYVASGNLADYTASVSIGGGGITLGGVLDRVRITTVNGTDTFDAGTINILWE